MLNDYCRKLPTHVFYFISLEFLIIICASTRCQRLFLFYALFLINLTLKHSCVCSALIFELALLRMFTLLNL